MHITQQHKDNGLIGQGFFRYSKLIGQYQCNYNVYSKFKVLSLLNDKAEWISNQSNPFNFQNLETFATRQLDWDWPYMHNLISFNVTFVWVWNWIDGKSRPNSTGKSLSFSHSNATVFKATFIILFRSHMAQCLDSSLCVDWFVKWMCK